MDELRALPLKCRAALFLMPLVGVALILLATSRYGAGLSPDSVSYISVARNISEKGEIVGFNDSLFTEWPPLYPALLASVYFLFGTDPLEAAAPVNAILFGLVIMLSSLIAIRLLSQKPKYVLLVVVALGLSMFLYDVSIMAWTEPLFLFLLLLSLFSLDAFIQGNDKITFVVMTATAALASLTRYMGITLILTGVCSILIFSRRPFLHRLRVAFLFGVVATIPLIIWSIRNYRLSGHLLGPRAVPRITIYDGIMDAAAVLGVLLIPWMPPLIAVGFVSIHSRLNIGHYWHALRNGLTKARSMSLFAVIYIFVLIAIAPAGGLSSIKLRYFLPAYIPLVMLIVLLVSTADNQIACSLTKPAYNRLIFLNFSFVLVFSIVTVSVSLFYHVLVGAGGFNSARWRDSEIVHFLQTELDLSEQRLYTNGQKGAYIVAGVEASYLPFAQGLTALERQERLSDLKGNWPDSPAYIVWFGAENKKRTFTVEELHEVADIFTLKTFDDGAIYCVSPTNLPLATPD